jgi:signal transduction histidine kinase/ligand-binding sensor domain-containing protein
VRIRGLAAGCVMAAFALAPASCWSIDRDRSLAQLHHASWTARDGAPTYVQMMAQTEDGFLWFATGSGLVRFDGAQFDRYVPARGEALPSRSIRSLLALPGNALMIGWIFGGATLLRDGRATNFGEQDGYPPGTTYQFLADSDGTIWAATTNALARFDGARWHRIGAEWNFAGQRAIAIFLDRDGTMGAFTDSTLMTLPKGGTAFLPTGGKSTTRTPIIRSNDGTLFLSDARGVRSIASLAQYDDIDRPWIVRAKPSDVVVRILADRDGSLWFGDARGVRRISHPERRDATVEYFSKSEGLSDAKADTLFEDREGNIWTTTPSGVDRFRVGSFVPPAGVLKVNFAAMAPDSNGGLIFAEFGGAGRHLAVDGTVREFGPILATCAYRDPDGIVWFGSQPTAPRIAELFRYERGRVDRVNLPADIPPNFDVQSITMDTSRSLWISVVRKGIYRLSAGAWSQPPQLPDAGRVPAVVMAADSEGRVWLGYPGNRVALWDNGKVRIYTAAEGLEVGNVLAIHEKGTHLWVAGERGLAIFESDRFRTLSTEDPEVLRGITGLVETGVGDLWLHGSAGAILVKAEQIQDALRQPSHAMTYRLFDSDDGLAGMATDVRPLPTLVAGSDGRLWFATNRGVFMLDPRRIATNKIAPMVVVKAALAGGARYLPSERIDLPALTTSLQVDYTATNIAAPRRMRFRYMLSGVDPDWQDAGARRQAFYTNLGPGSYRFQVIAANEDGVLNPAGASFDFAIAPAWYQTKWFLALCFLAAIAALALGYRMRVARVSSHIQARLQERQLERERIARDLHDTLLQGFQGLLLTFTAAMRRIPPGEPARAMMEKALERGSGVLAEGRNRVRDLRDSVVFQGDLPAALKDAAEDFAQAHPATFALAVQGDTRDLHPLVLEEAYRIGREALANAYRHAAAEKIEVEVTFDPAQLRIRIRDDGKGIDGEVLVNGVPGHWGMPGMRERAQKLGARLLIRSGSGSGTDVELDIPGAVAYDSP